MCPYRRCILLDIAWVVVKRAVLFLTLQGSCILDHLGIQPIQGIVRDGIFHHHQAVMVQAANGNFEVFRR